MVAKGNDKVYISFNTNHSVIVNGEIIQDSNVGVDEWYYLVCKLYYW